MPVTSLERSLWLDEAARPGYWRDVRFPNRAAEWGVVSVRKRATLAGREGGPNPMLALKKEIQALARIRP
jgi:hypothetical protein